VVIEIGGNLLAAVVVAVLAVLVVEWWRFRAGADARRLR
jgi:hypothetical protein